MLSWVCSRLTYANVVATGALFIALGGGAYALSGVPDRNGVYHACASNKTGALRLVKSASSCQKAVPRGKHRTPGELAVTWNQQGLRGVQGVQGPQGVRGPQGGQGLQGIQGLPGGVGPTAGFASTANGTPPTNPEATNWATLNITSPTSGRLFVVAQADPGTVCITATPCETDWGIYLDGAPVPGTLRLVQAAASGSSDKAVVMYGVTDTVSAGPHTLRLQDKKGTSGSPIPDMTDTPQIGAILLGG